ncbi:nucleotidyltransferase [Bifidobacterium lemurum]|nr:nucleotidyltransferase [Bifidobacterium lemurum]
MTKKLNRYFYDSDSDTDNMIVVGSVGRGTAVAQTSDIDVLYDLPSDIKKQYSDHQHGQTDLLQDIRNTLLERFPQTTIKGDGQAVVIDFSSKRFTIDLVPAFANTDGSFDYPDTHDGGSWKRTDPFPEQKACARMEEESFGWFVRLCNSTRAWADAQGISFSGLLIDTLVNNYLNGHMPKSAAFDETYTMLQELFSYFGRQNQQQSFWHALGSNQQIRDKGKGKFIRKASKAADKLEQAESEEEREDALSDLFGKLFTSSIVDGESKRHQSNWLRDYRCSDQEEFIEDRFPIRISMDVYIDCKITQNGFRPFFLSGLLRERMPLRRDKQLRFFIQKPTEMDQSCVVYWKIRNRGEEAYRRNMLRGQIIKDEGKHERIEHSNFNGNHFVECYVVRDGICIGRDRIIVPISE